MMNDVYEYLDTLIPNPICELNYQKDYELLIATVLSAQCTDKRVNEVTKVLFAKYDIFSLARANIEDIRLIIRSAGSYNKKSVYIMEIARRLTKDFNGRVPNNPDYLEMLPGVGKKTVNVVLKNIFDVPCIPVDTHVERVSKRLGFASNDASPLEVEQKLMNLIPKNKWNRVSEQILLFGRYHCKSVKPNCDSCLLKDRCCNINR